MARLLSGTLLGNARVSAGDPRFLDLLDQTLRRIPTGASPISTVTEVRLELRGKRRGLVGLTTWGRTGGAHRQVLTFYRDLLGQLSDGAAKAVIVHEIAHAWLNENVRPEDSREREDQADDLARRWGFGDELRALDEETETIWESPESRRFSW